MRQQTKGQGIREFFEIEAQSILERYKTVEKILPSLKHTGSKHPAEEGRFVESLIRDFLNKHLPKNLRAMSGFIIKPSTKTGLDNFARVNFENDLHSKQLDIIVYDISNYPIYEQFEEFCIVPPEGVIAILSIKKTLRMKDISAELQSLHETYEICKNEHLRSPYFGLFAFSIDSNLTKLVYKNLFNKVSKEYQNAPFDAMLNELTIINSFMFFKYRKESSDLPGMCKYVNIDLKNKSNIALQRLLQSILGVYYYRLPSHNIERPGFVSFEKGTFGDAPTIGYIKYT